MMKRIGCNIFIQTTYLGLTRFWTFFLLGCIGPVVLYAQSDDFHKRYEEVYMYTIATDINEARRIADSLVSVAADDEQKAKSLMLLANIQHSLGNLSESITTVLKIQRIANKSKRVDWQSRSSGFLASTFRSVGLFAESKRHLEQAEIANERQKNMPGYITTKVNILQEKVFHAMEDSLYDQALSYLREGDTYLKQDTSNDVRTVLAKATNDQLKAVCYLHTGQLAQADSLLSQSLQRLGGKESNLRSYIYRAQAESALQKEQYDSVYHYLQLAEPYIATSQREELKILLFSTFTRYYQAIGDHKRAVHYNELYQEVSRERGRFARQISNELVRKLNKEKQDYEAKVRNGWVIFFGVVFLMGSILVYLFIKRRNEHKKYQKLIHDLENEKSLAVNASGQVIALQKNVREENTDKEMAISIGTETRLLSQLEALEDTAFFLDKDVSLTALSSQLNTNQRYVSFIIRKHRNMDFNSYIQHYRIHYIMNRVKLEPGLLDYKLSYLADLAGFSSHSKFSATFKSVTGIPPSVFIHYTKEELGR